MKKRHEGGSLPKRSKVPKSITQAYLRCLREAAGIAPLPLNQGRFPVVFYLHYARQPSSATSVDVKGILIALTGTKEMSEDESS